MRTFTLFLFTLSILITSLAFAADEDQTPQPESPSYQVTVTGDRLEEPINEKTDSVTVITHEQIEQHQWHYVVDALKQVPGVAIVQSGSPGKTTSTFIRGGGSSQVLVLIDGIPINDPYFGQIQLENLVTDDVDRIEILKGPQSPLYGSDAMSGVIQIFTRNGQPGNSVRTSFEGGSYHTFREQAGFSGSTGKARYAANFSRNDTDGQLNNDDFSENAFTASGGYQFDDQNKISFRGQALDSTTGLPFGFGFIPAPHQRQDSNLGILGGSYQHNAGPLFNLNSTLSYTRLKYHIEDPDNTFYPFADSKSDVIQFTTQNDSHFGNIDTLTTGYEYEHWNINADDVTGQFIQDMTIGNHALFVQEKVETSRWILTGGLRWDHYTSFGDTVNPRVSAGYKLSEQTKIRSSYGSAFRAPSAGELALPFYGNPDLQPEKSHSWEIGMDQYWTPNISMSATWFDNRYEDLITFDPNTFIAENIASAKTYGLELSGTAHWHGWSYNAGYTYLHTEDEQTGLRLYRRPTHSVNAGVAYDAANWGASGSIQGVSDRLEPDFNTFPVSNTLNPGYGRVDLAGYYSILHQVKLKLRIENLFDKDYEEALGYKALGRGFYGGIDATF